MLFVPRDAVADLVGGDGDAATLDAGALAGAGSAGRGDQFGQLVRLRRSGVLDGFVGDGVGDAFLEGPGDVREGNESSPLASHTLQRVGSRIASHPPDTSAPGWPARGLRWWF